MAATWKVCPYLASILLSLAVTSWAAAQDDLYEIVEVLASPTFSSFEAARQGLDDNQVMVRQELAYQQLGRLSPTDSRLNDFRLNRLSDLSACNRSLRTIRELDSTVPDIEGLVTKTLIASPALYKTAKANYDNEQAVYNQDDRDALAKLTEKAITEIIKAGYNAYQASEERTNYRTYYRAARLKALEIESLVQAEASSSAFTQYGMGCIVNFSSDGEIVTVDELLENSPAQKAGIRAGDQLVSANGQSLSRDNFKSAIGLRDEPASSAVKLVTRRDGKNRTVSLVRDMPVVLPLLTVDVNGSFDGFFNSDEIFVTNTSGHDLSNVTLFVDVNGKHGPAAENSRDRHMHFVRSWPNAETRVLSYLSSAKHSLASNQSVDQITNVQFRIYSDQFTQTENYIYTAERFTADVQAYLGERRFTSQWFSYPDGHLFYNSGVTIESSDGSSFPATSMTLTVTSGSTSKSFQYKLDGDVFDGSEYFSHSAFNGMSVDRIDVSFTLPYTNHTVDAYWLY